MDCRRRGACDFASAPPVLPLPFKAKGEEEILYMVGYVEAGADVPGEGGGPVELWD